MLEVKGIEAAYAGAVALRNVSFQVRDGEVVTLIGANGAGKTTTLNVISGLMRPRQGSVIWNAADLTKTPAHRLISLGIGYCREGRQLFADMTLRENLLMGGYAIRSGKKLDSRIEEVAALFPEVSDRMGQFAGTLSGGEQQMVALMRALVTEPRLLLLDEPSLGLSPIATKRVLSVLPQLAAQGTSVLLVEQNAVQALAYSDRAYVIQVGEIVASGRSADLANDHSLMDAYLGGLAAE
jgi:branched-chain amino acid transport system ATP-binding protein